MKKIVLLSSLLFMFLSLLSGADSTAQVSYDQDTRDLPTATLKSASRLFKEKDDLTSVILIIPSGSVVTVTGMDSTYYKVIFEEAEGYILKRHAAMNAGEVSTDRVIESPATVMETRPVQKSQVSRFTYLESKYGSGMAARLYAGKIWKGMSSEMVQDSWGSPGKINKVIRGSTIKEEWIYRNTWLYIVDGMLLDWGPAVRK